MYDGDYLVWRGLPAPLIVSELLLDNDRSLSEAARSSELNEAEVVERRGASDRVVRRKRLRGDLATTSYGFLNAAMVRTTLAGGRMRGKFCP